MILFNPSAGYGLLKPGLPLQSMTFINDKLPAEG
jgi:hypothetical protein